MTALTIILAAAVFVLVILTLVAMASTLRAGRELQRELDRIRKGRER